MDSLLASVKNKRLAMSRVRRVCCCAALGVESGLTSGIPPYARLLALTGKGREILGEIKKTSEIPIITKPATVRELGDESLRIFELGSAAHDLYALGYRAVEERRGGADWRTGPRIIE